MSIAQQIQATRPFKWVIAPRLIAGLPLAGIGFMHLIGSAPLRPILDAAGIPLAGLNAVVAPIVQVVAGLSLISGTFARIGGAMGVLTMLAALYAHAVVETWPNPDEPPIALPLAVLAASAVVVWSGGGAWSVDARRPLPRTTEDAS